MAQTKRDIEHLELGNQVTRALQEENCGKYWNVRHINLRTKTIEKRVYQPKKVVPKTSSKSRGRAQVYPSTRRRVRKRDNHTCQYCGKKVMRDPKRSADKMVIDHVVPVSRGGSDKLSNLVIACLPCDKIKSDSTLEELGWQVPAVLSHYQLQEASR